MMKSTVFALFLLNAWLQMSNIAAFSMQSSRFVSRSVLKMEYIPDGLTKEQWALIKKKVFVHAIIFFLKTHSYESI